MKKMNAIPQTQPADVGIIIGRFQIHELHEAHCDLIETVSSSHDRVILFLGLSPLRNTSSNPLDFNTRRKMILEKYPKIEIYYIEDNPSDEVWSRNLDREITKWLKPNQTAMLYGGRESFISSYKGKYPVTELEASKFISGTEIRKRISNNFEANTSFRAGVISASLNRFPTCYGTVDVAVIKDTKVLMCSKDASGDRLMFVGGFADPSSTSYEEDAKREVMEETKVEIDNLKYIGSTIIDDWRYRKEIDKIKTMLFVAKYVFGRPEASDDIAYVEWVEISDLLSGKVTVAKEHQVLVEMLGQYLATNKL